MDVRKFNRYVAQHAAPAPHVSAIFSLMPRNDLACSLLTEQQNRPLLSALILAPEEPGNVPFGLGVGPHLGAKPANTLANVGRNGEIVFSTRSICRQQCSFEVNEFTGAILFRDWSSKYTTQTVGKTARSFEYGRHPRRVVVTPTCNREIEFGPVGNRYRFMIIWHAKPPETTALSRQIDIIRVARTLDDNETELPSGMVTRIHTAKDPSLKLRWVSKITLGRGTYGKVFSALDIDTGDAFAVKRIKGPGSRERLKAIRPQYREYIHSQENDEGHIEIFMLLKDGNVEGLVAQGVFIQQVECDTLLRSMLEALTYLHGLPQPIIHRDVKPANILVSGLDADAGAEGGPKWRYQLADFGLSNYSAMAKTFGGSPGFAAPEMYCGDKQTAKMDVWSLLVTVLYASKPGFRDAMRARCGSIPVQFMKDLVQEAVSTPTFSILSDMAAVEPEQRASAEETLYKVYTERLYRMDLDTPSKPIEVDKVVAGPSANRALPRAKPSRRQPLADVAAGDGQITRRITRNAAKRPVYI